MRKVADLLEKKKFDLVYFVFGFGFLTWIMDMFHDLEGRGGVIVLICAFEIIPTRRGVNLKILQNSEQILPIGNFLPYSSQF